MKNHSLSRRDFLNLSLGATASALLVACQPRVPESAVEVEAPIEEDTETVEVEAEVEMEEPATAPPAEPVDLRFIHWWGEMLNEPCGLLEEKFNVTITQEPASEAYDEKLLTMFAGGVAPDLLVIAQDWGAPQFFTGDLLLPLDDVLETANVDPDLWAAPPTDQRFQGSILGMQLFLWQVQGAAVNLDLIEKEGFEVPHPWPFWGTEEFDNWSWDKFVDNLKACTKIGADGETEIYGSCRTLEWFDENYITGTYENGGQLLDSYDYRETECLVDSPEVCGVVQQLTDLVVTHKVAPPMGVEAGFPEGLFRSQKGVVFIFWMAYSGYGLEEDLGFRYRVIMLPHYGKGRRIMKAGNMVCVNKDSPNLDVAARIAVAMGTDAEFMEVWVPAMTFVPAYNPMPFVRAETDPAIQETLKIWLARYSAYSECRPCTEDVQIVEGHRGRGSFRAASTAIQHVLAGEKTVEQAMADAKVEIDATIAETPVPW
ncbi:MAG: extracellular solute-binding protein [Chloroflexi bacterium]|nr:extracellular solute-binding protein [Chloroflexota bacterium]